MSKVNLTSILILSILLLLGGLLYVIHVNDKIQEKIATHEQNKVALKNELIISENKNGELVASKAALEMEKGEVEKYNKSLASELSKANEEVTRLNRILIEYENGPQISENDQVVDYGDNVFGINWEFRRNYTEENKRLIQGTTKFKYDPKAFSIIPLQTTLTKDYMSFVFVSGVSEKDGIISGFGSSPMPGITIPNMDSWMKPRKSSKNKFGLSLYSGYGLTYSTNTNMVYHGLQVGGGVTYKFW